MSNNNNVTKSNYLSQSTRLIQSLPTAAYVAVDLEMTGIQLPSSSRPNRDDTPERRYAKLKEVPERYGIVQVGVAVFSESREWRRWRERAERRERSRVIATAGEGKTKGKGKGKAKAKAKATKKKTRGKRKAKAAAKVVAGGVRERRRRRGVGANEGSTSDASEEDSEDEMDGSSDDDNDDSSDYDEFDSGIDEEDHEEEEEPAEFTVRKYNFYLFPPTSTNDATTREVALNPSTIAFLNKHGMDWNTWMREGIPFVTGDVAESSLRRFHEKYAEKEEEEEEGGGSSSTAAGRGGAASSSATSPHRGGAPRNPNNRVILSRPDDIAFVARTMAGLREWIDAAVRPGVATRRVPGAVGVLAAAAAGNGDNDSDADEGAAAAAAAAVAPPPVVSTGPSREPEGCSYILPPTNSFLRRALYETIEAEYPTLILERMDGNRIKVLRMNAEERKARELRLKTEEWERVHRDRIGFWDVFWALSLANRGELRINEDGGVYAEDEHDADEEDGRDEMSYDEVIPRPILSRLSGVPGDLSHMTARSPPSMAADPHSTSRTSARTAGSGSRKAAAASKRRKKSKSKSKSRSKSNSTADIATKDPTKPRRQIPLIVHNGLMDLLFLLTHFHSPKLPQSYVGAKQLIHKYFPCVFDTKILATECSDEEVRGGNTALGELYGRVCSQGAGGSNEGEGDGTPVTPRIIVLGEESEVDDNGRQVGQAHQADYDAYMTGAVFHAMARRIMRGDGYKRMMERKMELRSSVRGVGGMAFLGDTGAGDGDREDWEAVRYFGLNKLYLMQTLYTINIADPIGPDPLNRGMDPNTTYRVVGIDKSITTRDIIGALRNAADRAYESVYDRRLGFEIVWVDDCTFMVATRAPDDGAVDASDLTEGERADMLTRHGKAIEDTLRRRFPSQHICTLKQHLELSKKQTGSPLIIAEAADAHGGMLSSAYSSFSESISGIMERLFGSMKRDRDDGGDGRGDSEEDGGNSGRAKRRRVEM